MYLQSLACFVKDSWTLHMTYVNIEHNMPHCGIAGLFLQNTESACNNVHKYNLSVQLNGRELRKRTYAA